METAWGRVGKRVQCILCKIWMETRCPEEIRKEQKEPEFTLWEQEWHSYILLLAELSLFKVQGQRPEDTEEINQSDSGNDPEFSYRHRCEEGESRRGSFPSLLLLSTLCWAAWREQK